MANHDSTPYGVIYRIKNLINSKVYIGQTTAPLMDRWGAHCRPDSYCVAIRNAIQKYGKENFDIVEIDQAASKDDLDEKEALYIKQYDSMNSLKGYNLMSGGSFGKHSEESKRRMSESVRKAYERPEVRINFRASKLGKKRSESYCKKASQRMLGTVVSAEVRTKIAKTVEAYWKDESYRAKVSEGQRKARSADEYRQMIARNTKEQWSDPEKKEKLLSSMTAGKLAMWADPIRKAAIVAKRNETNAAKRRHSA